MSYQQSPPQCSYCGGYHYLLGQTFKLPDGTHTHCRKEAAVKQRWPDAPVKESGDHRQSNSR